MEEFVLVKELSLTEAGRMAEQIMRARPSIKQGTPRFFGEWFGRPHDNRVITKTASAENNRLTIRFNGGETLEVWDPQDLTVGPASFRIMRASRVRWKWFYDLIRFPPWFHHCLDYVAREDGTVEAQTDLGQQKRYVLQPSTAPAVEIV